MTIKIGDKYVHTVLGYVDDSGATVITEDAELATMTGRYEDRRRRNRRTQPHMSGRRWTQRNQMPTTWKRKRRKRTVRPNCSIGWRTPRRRSPYRATWSAAPTRARTAGRAAGAPFPQWSASRTAAPTRSAGCGGRLRQAGH